MLRQLKVDVGPHHLLLFCLCVVTKARRIPPLFGVPLCFPCSMSFLAHLFLFHHLPGNPRAGQDAVGNGRGSCGCADLTNDRLAVWDAQCPHCLLACQLADALS